MDEFKPYCKRCRKPIVFGQLMGTSTGVGETYWFHEEPRDCGILETWTHAADQRPEDD